MRDEPLTSAGADGHALAAWIEERRARIVAAWEVAARALPKARQLERLLLRDNIPDLVDEIASAARAQGVATSARFPEPTPVAHALDRLERGFDLEEVIEEYSALRACILDALAEVPAGPRECAFVDRAIDSAMQRAVTAFAGARERTLRAIDRIAQASGESEDLETFLAQLLRVLVQTNSAVDTAAVFLWEDERLRARAAIGLEEEVRAGFSVALGEGFVGRIAAERAPAELRAAANDPSVLMAAVRARGIRGLYGVPLLDGEQLVGVAHMGSITAYEFSDEDKLLFRSLATRASLFIQRARTLAAERAARKALELQEVRLRESEERLRAFFEAAGVGMAEAAPDTGRLLRVNDTFCALAGRSREELLAATLHDLGPAEERAEDREGVARVVRGDAPSHVREKRFVHEDGREVWVLETVTVTRDAAGRPLRTVAVVQDVTARRRAEEELARAALFRDRLLAIVGHDLRNPLGAVRLGAGLITKRAQAPEDAATAERIGRSAARMERIIADLVDVAGTRYGDGMAVSRRPVDAAEVVRHVVEEHQLTHPDRSITLEVHGDLRGELDPDRFAQVAANLVSNALAHGRVDAPVRVALRGQGSELSLEVHNEGTPIPPEVVPDLFEPFRRGRSDSATRRGLGLGLFIVAEIVRAHGGHVSVRSSPQDGTIFTVRVPRSARA